MIKRFLFTLLFLLPQWVLYAQFDDKMKHHVIIALDEVLDKSDRTWPQREAFKRVFEQRLVDSILREGDYLSIVGFSSDETVQNLNDFTYTLQDSILGGNLGWMPYNNDLKDRISLRWNEIMDLKHRKHKGWSPFSMISLAKMYAFAPVNKKKASQYVNRTFVVLITDKIFNGNDIYDEVINFCDFNGSITPMMVQDYGQRVSSEYFIRQLNNDHKQQPRSRYVDLCEYIPLQSGLTLPTLLDYKAGNIVAQRVKGGLYKLDINALSRHNPRYNLLQLRYRIMDTDGAIMLDTLCKASIGSDGDYEPIGQFNVSYDLGENLNAASVTIDAWASLNDGVYNATVLTPVKGAPDYLASKGLSVTIPIEYEEASKILGLVPLPGKLQFDDNQEYANAKVSAWALAIVAVLALSLFGFLIVLIVRRIRTYRIKAEDISFKKV